MMRVLVTGATGFVGNAVVHRLVEAGHKVRCMVRRGSNTGDLVDIVWEKTIGDLRSLDDCRAAADGMEAVVHCAALVTDYGPWKNFKQINVEGSRNLAEAALRVKVGRFVYLSTNDVLGATADRTIDDTLPYRKTGFPYPDTKIEAETLLFDLYRKRSLPLVALRPAWVYGPGDKTFIPELVDAMNKGVMCYFGDKRNKIYLNYIDNLVDAMILALEKDEAVGRSYLLTDDEPISWERLCKALADGLDLKAPWITVPLVAAKAAALGMESAWSAARIKSRPFLTRYALKFMSSNLRYDINRARQELGYEPRVDVEEGLERTIDWLKATGIEQIKTK
jgi:nucleoside-diphosphate-sugar epimerase